MKFWDFILKLEQNETIQKTKRNKTKKMNFFGDDEDRFLIFSKGA